MAVVLPIRVCLDVAHDHTLASVSRRAARTGFRANTSSINGARKLRRKVWSGALHDAPLLSVEKQDRAESAALLFDEQYDSFQYLFQRRAFSDPLEDVDLLKTGRLAFHIPTSSGFGLWFSLHQFILLGQSPDLPVATRRERKFL